VEGHRRHGQQALIATRGLHHLAIRVRDLAAAERFYGGLLGLRVVKRWPAVSGPGERSIWVDTGDGAFLALEIAGAAHAHAHADADADGLHLVALRIDVADRAAWKERLARAGVAVYHETRFTIYLRDPEGNRVGLSHYPAPDGGAGAA
jgi:catechol 2,3-dioxygenase-like lactoylglutathione lyase family enzyme